ncbi:MAG: phosphoglycerate mutase [Candidatus Peregrinibacteria bacterium Gr01-1014_25]|nr:MAG: phosphoglycerate mutase [Candidatus Peregrinibacteria bacterium Gr01-1014_25]
MSILILVRHGQSQWNLENRFTGWVDVPLSAQGERDAATSGRALAGRRFDIAFTSRLKRAQETLTIILKTMKHAKVPIEYDSALNERHYGDLQGLDKAETAAKFGEQQVKLWRRSYGTRPPNGESIEDCERRTTPFFVQYILPLVAAGKNVIVAAHGNSMRPMFKLLDHLDPDTTATLEVGLCLPYIYTFEGERMVKKEVLAVPDIVATGTADIHAKGR